MWTPFYALLTERGCPPNRVNPTIRFELGSFWPKDSLFNDTEDAHVYHPPTTVLRLSTGRLVPKSARLAKYTKSQLAFNAFGSKVGMGQFVRQLSDNILANGDPDEVSRFFRPSVRAQIIAFPRNIFPPAVGDLVIKDGEVRMCWEGHETDPKVVEAGFRLLDAMVAPE